MPWRRTVPRLILWQHSFRPISSARRVCGPGWQWPRYFSLQRSGCAAIKDPFDSQERLIQALAEGKGGTTMSTAVMTNRLELNSVAETALKAAARFWFAVAVIGQLVFAFAVASFYCLTTL